jgi:glyoxylase-like metal-dependent hydrolase (beta-lactamase superfamily II)
MNQAERSSATGRGVRPLGHEVFEIDTRMAGHDKITAGYLIRAERPCLVETGTAPSARVVRDALAGLGIGPRDLATVVVTHIHLDHAGGAGDIAAMFPEAEIVVHQRGARHLADPSRLMDSARRVYGPALDALFGELAPTPAERIRAVEERGSIDLGGGGHGDRADQAAVRGARARCRPGAQRQVRAPDRRGPQRVRHHALARETGASRPLTAPGNHHPPRVR